MPLLYCTCVPPLYVTSFVASTLPFERTSCHEIVASVTAYAPKLKRKTLANEGPARTLRSPTPAASLTFTAGMSWPKMPFADVLNVRDVMARWLAMLSSTSTSIAPVPLVMPKTPRTTSPLVTVVRGPTKNDCGFVAPLPSCQTRSIEAGSAEALWMMKSVDHWLPFAPGAGPSAGMMEGAGPGGWFVVDERGGPRAAVRAGAGARRGNDEGRGAGREGQQRQRGDSENALQHRVFLLLTASCSAVDTLLGIESSNCFMLIAH